VVKELLVQEGEVAKVGSGLCLIEVDEEVLDGADPAVTEPLGTPSKEPTETPAATPSSPSDIPVLPRRLHPLDPNNESAGKSSNADRVFAAPSVRHFARQMGVDLSELAPGSGKEGRIVKSDIEARLAGGQAPQMAAMSEQREDVVVELGRTRYGMWKAMVKVCVEISELSHLLIIL